MKEEVRARQKDMPKENVSSPYEERESFQDQTSKSIKETLKNTFSSVKAKWQSSQSGAQPKPKRAKMSDGFNSASFNGRDQSEMNDSPKAQEWTPRNE